MYNYWYSWYTRKRIITHINVCIQKNKYSYKCMNTQIKLPKPDLPSYHGILRACRSQLKQKPHSIIILPWKFDLHIYHKFRGKDFWKRSKRWKVIKNHLCENFFHIPIRLSHGHLRHIKNKKSKSFPATEKYKKFLKKFRKVLFDGKLFGNVHWKKYHQKPETNPETWYVNEKFEVMVECYISLER